jgi:ABC-type glycerol-3-phosphate transport system substrate-binding protein
MLKKMGIGVFLFALIMAVAFPVFAGGGNDLKGNSIVVGNFWGNYDVNTHKPSNEDQEIGLEWRKKILKDNSFTMQERQVAGWGEMMDTIVTSVMAGKPAAHAFWVTPDWAMILYKQGLLYPISDSKAVNLKTSTPIAFKQVAYNQDAAALFTFGGKQYAIGIGYGTGNRVTGIYFNKRLFREAGLSPDLPYDMQKDGTWTWENFIDVCKKLTRDVNNNGIIDTYAMCADIAEVILEEAVFSNGANFVAKNAQGQFVNASGRPEFIEALQYSVRLRNEGIMMPRPEGSNWDWNLPMFLDGHVAMLMDAEWRKDQFADLSYDWGFVLFPKGPKSKDYRFADDFNVLIIPSTFKSADVDAILKGVNLWYTPTTEDWKSGMYSQFRDRRAVDETMAMIRGGKNGAFRNYALIPGFNKGDIAWQMWWYDGEPAQLVESVSQNWNALISDFNKK